MHISVAVGLLDSKVVDLRRSSHPIFVAISSLKPLLFNGLNNTLRFVDTREASDSGIQEERHSVGGVWPLYQPVQSHGVPPLALHALLSGSAAINH